MALADMRAALERSERHSAYLRAFSSASDADRQKIGERIDSLSTLGLSVEAFTDQVYQIAVERGESSRFDPNEELSMDEIAKRLASHIAFSRRHIEELLSNKRLRMN